MKSNIRNRSIFIGILITIFYSYSVYGVYAAGNNSHFLQAAGTQSLYSTEIASSRGVIYDCNLEPLTNTDSQILAVCTPTAQCLSQLMPIAEESIDMESAIQEGKPVVVPVESKEDIDGVRYFTVSRRYSSDSLCTNLIGYIDGEGNGVTGIEAACDDLLRENSGTISVTYTADALGRMIPGEEWNVDSSYSDSPAGVVLTIDKEIQQAAEDAASGKLTKGAVVVLSIPDGKIRAMVSCPDFDPVNLGDSLQAADSPMINRCLTAYAPGSVFKLVLAATALESNFDDRERYTCTGSTNTDGLSFSCYGGDAHGEVNLSTALQKSCNCYFINLSKRLFPHAMTGMALNLGLGSTTTLCDQLFGESGCIPTISSYSSPRELSNFAIGQGEVAITPLQAAAMINAIANGGSYIIPTILEGETDDGKEVAKQTQSVAGISAMEVSVALQLKTYMEATVKYGTAGKGQSDLYTAGAKTGTAETGVYQNGSQLLNYWYCGYVGAGPTPEYAIVVLQEGAAEGDNPTGEIFREIGEFVCGEKE